MTRFALRPAPKLNPTRSPQPVPTPSKAPARPGRKTKPGRKTEPVRETGPTLAPPVPMPELRPVPLPAKTTQMPPAATSVNLAPAAGAVAGQFVKAATIAAQFDLDADELTYVLAQLPEHSVGGLSRYRASDVAALLQAAA
jgi:hypothetical protein